LTEHTDVHRKLILIKGIVEHIFDIALFDDGKKFAVHALEKR
jgi:hypothetical protein